VETTLGDFGPVEKRYHMCRRRRWLRTRRLVNVDNLPATEQVSTFRSRSLIISSTDKSGYIIGVFTNVNTIKQKCVCVLEGKERVSIDVRGLGICPILHNEISFHRAQNGHRETKTMASQDGH
jgi:hypothetical protein